MRPCSTCGAELGHDHAPGCPQLDERPRPELYGYGEPEAFAELSALLSNLAGDLASLSVRLDRLSRLVRAWAAQKHDSSAQDGV